MSFWTHLLRLSLAICWLLALNLSRPAAAEDYSARSLTASSKLESLLSGKNVAKKSPSKPEESFLSLVRRDHHSTFERAEIVSAEPIDNVLSPHQLSEAELEAVFPGYSNDFHASLDDEQLTVAGSADVLSPHQLSAAELEAVFPFVAHTDVVESNEPEPEFDDNEVTLSPHRLPDHVLKAIFSTDAQLDSDAQLAIEMAADGSSIQTEEWLLADSVVENDAVSEDDAVEDVDNVEKLHEIPLESISPSGTQFQFNGQPLNHLTDIELEAQYRTGSDINDVSLLRGSVSLANRLQRGVTADQRLTVEHRGTYFQSETVTRSRAVRVTRTSPQVIDGFGIHLSLTGACLDGGSITEERCSYTPAIRTADVNDVLDFRQMGRLLTEGVVGEVVTSESLAAIAQPGFQRGADGQAIGLDLRFPNTGTRPANSSSDRVTVTRTEISDITPIFTLAQRRQIVQMNDEEAVLGITMRGNSFVVEDDNNLLSALLQAGIALLPDAIPQVAATGEPYNPQVNRSLFLAANNVRLPSRSLTLYHSGIARARSLDVEATQNVEAAQDVEATQNKLPPARFLGIWLGFSPIKTYQITTQLSDQNLDETRLVRTVGTEGGGGTLDNGNRLQFTSVVDDETFFVDELHDSYVQIYQSFYETNNQTIEIENYTEQTTYHPHISFTGNTTTHNSSLNYYAGAIVPDDFNLYAGLDYVRSVGADLTYRLGSIFYTQADRDYYSQLSGSVKRRIPLSSNASLSVSGGFNWALDREDQIGDVEVNSRSSSVYGSANAKFNRFSVGIRGTVEGLIPDSARDSLRLQASAALTNALTFSGFLTPFSRSSSYARYGTSLSWRTAGRNSPLLKLSWTNNRYGYGRDSLGRDLSSYEDLFLFTLEL